MSLPLSDTELAEIRERVPSAVCPAAHPAEVDKGHVWVTGSLSGTDRCSACHLSQRALDSDEAVLLREVDRLRAELAKYVGHEPTIAAEMAELSRRLDAVVALLPDSPSEDINASWIPPRRIRAAVDGDTTALGAGQ